jgi:hypothetical protein
MVGNLYEPLGHIHKLKMVLGSDNIKNVYDIQRRLLVLKFTAGRSKRNISCRPHCSNSIKIIIFYGVKFILIGRSLYQYYR